jgi:excisionase family DNA binding protein
VPLHRSLPTSPIKTDRLGARRGLSREAQELVESPLVPKPAWLSVTQLGRRWQLDRRTIYKFIDSRILPAWKVGSHLYRVSVNDILQFEANYALQSGEPRGTHPEGSAPRVFASDSTRLVPENRRINGRELSGHARGRKL